MFSILVCEDDFAIKTMISTKARKLLSLYRSKWTRSFKVDGKTANRFSCFRYYDA